jgi:hypothetical protein
MKKMLKYLSTKNVKKMIVEGSITESHLMYYFFVMVAYDSFFHSLSVSDGPKMADGLWHQLNAWSFFVCSALIIVSCFIANGGINGSRFLTKYLPISITVGYKFAAVVLAVTMGLAVTNATPPVWFGTVFIYSVNVVMCCVFVYHIRQLTKLVG